MKKAICHYSLRRRFKNEKWTIKRLVEEADIFGMDGVDFHLGLMPTLAGAAEEIPKALAQYGLELAAISVRNDFNKDDTAAFQAELESVRNGIEFAARVKAPVVRVFGGMIAIERVKTPGVKELGMQRIVDGLGQSARVAEKNGVMLGLENHGYLPCTGQEQVEVIRKINSPFLKATVDIGNYMSCDQAGHVGTRIAAEEAVYVHLKDYRRIADAASPLGFRVEPCALNEGAVDHAECLRLLADAGYEGFVALEYEGLETEETALPRCVAFMHEVMKDL